MFALPSVGSNLFVWGVLGELEGSFSKDPSNKSPFILRPYFFIETARLAASAMAEGVRP